MCRRNTECLTLQHAVNIPCVRGVAVHLGYGRVQLKCDGIRWRMGGEVKNLCRRPWTSISTPLISAQRLYKLPLPCVAVCHHISTGLYRSQSEQRLSELPLPCVTVCLHISTGLYRSLSAQRLSEIPLPCVAVCHHISTGLYRSLSAQRLSERTVLTTAY